MTSPNSFRGRMSSPLLVARLYMRTERVEKLIGAITIESGHESRVRITRGPRARPACAVWSRCGSDYCSRLHRVHPHARCVVIHVVTLQKVAEPISTHFRLARPAAA